MCLPQPPEDTRESWPRDFTVAVNSRPTFQTRHLRVHIFGMLVLLPAKLGEELSDPELLPALRDTIVLVYVGAKSVSRGCSDQNPLSAWILPSALRSNSYHADGWSGPYVLHRIADLMTLTLVSLRVAGLAASKFYFLQYLGRCRRPSSAD